MGLVARLIRTMLVFVFASGLAGVVACDTDDGGEADGSEEPWSNPDWVPEEGQVRIESITPEPASIGESVTITGSFPDDGNRTWVMLTNSSPEIESFSQEQITITIPEAEAGMLITTVQVSVRGTESNSYQLDLADPFLTADGGTESLDSGIPPWDPSSGLPEEISSNGGVITIPPDPDWGTVEGFAFGGVPSPSFEFSVQQWFVTIPEGLPSGPILVTVTHDGVEEVIGSTTVL